jgi:hypothetical protein
MQELGATPIICNYAQNPGVHFDLKATVASIVGGYDAVIFNAACPGYEKLAKVLCDEGIRTYALYHGGFCGFAFDNLFDASERANLQTMLDWSKRGLVRKVGFVNRGSAEYFKALGYKTGWLPNVPAPSLEKHSDPSYWKEQGDINPHIGVFSKGNVMKNTMSAVAAALAIPNSRVHTVDGIGWAPPGFPEWDGSRLVTHGWLTKTALADAMARMHTNMMLSFTESYGLLVTESWGVGTPCIIGPACKPLLDEFEQNYWLQEYMYVERMDDASDILQKLRLCISNRAEVSAACKERVKLLRKFGLAHVEEFFND